MSEDVERSVPPAVTSHPFIIAVSVLILVSAIPILAQTKSERVEQELMKLENDLYSLQS